MHTLTDRRRKAPIEQKKEEVSTPVEQEPAPAAEKSETFDESIVIS